jgi:NAD(P)-dependent dehydrogenase (short-subunit alcohol dehydrogenase family)
MDLMLRNKPVLITGAAGTLGLATAKCFLEEGALVAITDLSGKESEPAVASLLNDHPKRAVFVPLDLSSDVSIAKAVESIHIAFGGVHTIVHNAASFHFSPMREWPDNTPLDRHYVVGLQGPVQLTREVWNRCPSSLSGSVVIVSSVAGHVSEPDAFAYTPIKAAQKGLVLSCAQEMAAHGGWAVAISPGHIWGPNHKVRVDAAGMTREQYEFSSASIQSTMHGRFLEPEEIAKWIVLAASPLGKAMTGQDLHVTLGIEPGGFNRRYNTSV